MKPSVKLKANSWIEQALKRGVIFSSKNDLIECWMAGYEQGQYDLSQELAIAFFKRFGDKYARRYDLADRGKNK